MSDCIFFKIKNYKSHAKSCNISIRNMLKSLDTLEGEGVKTSEEEWVWERKRVARERREEKKIIHSVYVPFNHSSDPVVAVSSSWPTFCSKEFFFFFYFILPLNPFSLAYRHCFFSSIWTGRMKKKIATFTFLLVTKPHIIIRSVISEYLGLRINRRVTL